MSRKTILICLITPFFVLWAGWLGLKVWSLNQPPVRVTQRKSIEVPVVPVYKAEYTPPKPDESACTEPARLLLQSLRTSGMWSGNDGGYELWHTPGKLKVVMVNDVVGASANFIPIALTDNDKRCLYPVAKALADKLLAERKAAQQREAVETLRKAVMP